MTYEFKNFEIMEPKFILGFEPEDKDYCKYNFNVVKWDKDHKHHWVIAKISWDEDEGAFDFESVGTRYLHDREDGLEDWLLAWIELKAVEYKYIEEE